MTHQARPRRPRDLSRRSARPRVRALARLETQRLHHAYLFTARAASARPRSRESQALNCEIGVSVRFCGAARCVGIDAGRSSTASIDAASTRRRRNDAVARERGLRADRRPLQGVRDRRGPHAVDARVQRDAQDARGTAAARRLRARDHRSAAGAGDRAVALPAVQPEEHAARGGGGAPGHGAVGRGRRLRSRRTRPDRARGRWQHARCAVAARPGDRLRWRRGARAGGARDARRGRRGLAGPDPRRAGGRRRARSSASPTRCWRQRAVRAHAGRPRGAAAADRAGASRRRRRRRRSGHAPNASRRRLPRKTCRSGTRS